MTGWLRGLAGTVTSQKDSLESPSPSHTHSPREPSACPAPAMSPCLLGCVVFCLLQAGESWGRGHLGGPSTKPVCCDCSIDPPSAGAVHAGVTQDPRFQVVRTGQSTTLRCTQDLGQNSMYCYRQDLGLRVRLIHYSRGPLTTEKGDMLDGYNVFRSSKENFPLMLESANPS